MADDLVAALADELFEGFVAPQVAPGGVLVEQRVGNGFDQLADKIQILLERRLGVLDGAHVGHGADQADDIAAGIPDRIYLQQDSDVLAILCPADLFADEAAQG